MKTLQQKGYRLTKPRQEIVKVLKQYPLTAQELYDSLRKRNSVIDLTSVYRSLELFVTLGIVRTLELGEAKRRYELVDEKNHHHHLVCNTCGSIADIRITEEPFVTEVREKTTFKVDHHHLEFFGLCANCQ